MKSFFYIAIVLTLCLLALNACKTSKKVLSEQEIEALPKMVTFAKSACRGRCPHFELNIYEGGHMTFEGKRFTKQKGKVFDKLSEKELLKLKQDCAAADIWDFRSEYGMRIMDLPTITIHLFEKDRDKNIKWRMKPPTPLATLDAELMKIIYDRDWIEKSILMEKKASKMPEGILGNEMIVQFNKQIDVQKWCERYKRYDVSVKRTISKTTPIYLMVFDVARMSPNKMLAIIKKDKDVVKAEFNKKISPRTR
jgi:hypothetical protein